MEMWTRPFDILQKVICTYLTFRYICPVQPYLVAYATQYKKCILTRIILYLLRKPLSHHQRYFYDIFLPLDRPREKEEAGGRIMKEQ